MIDIAKTNKGKFHIMVGDKVQNVFVSNIPFNEITESIDFCLRSYFNHA